MLSKEEILKCADRLQELEKLDVVKEFRYVLHEVVNYPQEEPKQEYYKSSKIRDYYIKLPYEEFTILDNGKYGFKKHSYDAIGKKKDNKSTLYLCLSLCNYSKEQIMQYIDKHIKEEDEDVE
ncbi:hypothetical protein [Amedibacillus dolichus]|nr:hypothetical protein [Amedibacillus dolichus]